jgi:hypothetical protein
MGCVFSKNKFINLYLDNSINYSSLENNIHLEVIAYNINNEIISKKKIENFELFELFKIPIETSHINIYFIITSYNEQQFITNSIKKLHQNHKKPFNNKEIIKIQKIT